MKKERCPQLSFSLKEKVVAERPDEVLMPTVSPSSPCFAGTFSPGRRRRVILSQISDREPPGSHSMRGRSHAVREKAKLSALRLRFGRSSPRKDGNVSLPAPPATSPNTPAAF